MVRKIYKQYYRCATQNTPVAGVFGAEVKILVSDFDFNGVRNSDGTYSAAPGWFTQGGALPYDTWWAFTPPSESGTQYDFSWTATNKDDTETEYIVRVTMTEDCSVDIGCETGSRSQPVSFLLWLNREGGYNYFPFHGKKSFEVKIPDANTFVNDEYTARNTSRRGVFNGETLSTGEIPQEGLDLLQSLKESIQVYYVENPFDSGEQIYYPVILMDGDFVKRKTDERRWDVKVKFIYSQERIIQTQ